MIVSTVLDLPDIVPDDWDLFWNLWNHYSAPMIKIRNTVNAETTVGQQDLWKGIEIYQKSFNLAYKLPFLDIKTFLPKMYNQLKNLDIKGIRTVRLIQSLKDIGPHSDNFKDEWNIRYLFHCENPDKQWYYTPVNDKKSKTFLTLPQQSKWFSYNDKYCLHGSEFNPLYPKILLQVYCDNNLELVQKGIKKYPEHIIEL